MKKKLSIFLLTAIMAVSGTMAITSASKSVKAEEVKLYTEYFTYDDNVILEANKKAPLYYEDGTKFTGGLNDHKGQNYAGKAIGLGFTVKGDTEFSLVKPIYLGDNDIYTPMFEYMITPTTPIEQSSTSPGSSTREFERLTITLTDVNDPDNKVVISNLASSTNSKQTWIEVSTPNHVRAGMNNGILTSEDFKNYGSGTGIQSGFTGDSRFIATLFYDFNENAFYTYRTFYNSQLYNSTMNVVRDLDDGAHFMPGDTPWTGFSNGFVNVSFKVEGVSADSHFIFKSIDGQELLMENGVIVDNCVPSMAFDSAVVNNVPQGEVNKKYPFPSYSAYDFMDEFDVDVNFTVLDPNGNEVTSGVEEDGFIPTKAGKYTVKAQSVDSSGNNSEVQQIEVVVAEVLQDFTLYIPNEQIIHEAPVGKLINVPTAKLLGGSGNNYVKSSVIYAETGEVITTNNMFTPTKAGWYKIVYEYKDYLSDVYNFVIDIDVTLSNKPVFDEVSIPAAILSGAKYFIPNAIAKDYASFNGEGRVVDAVPEIKLVGVKGETPVNEDWAKLTTDYYIPNVDEGVLSLRYKAVSILDKDVYSYSDVYEIKVVKLSAFSALYKFFTHTENIEEEVVVVDGVSKQVSFVPLQDGESIQFINKLPESALGATINFDKGYNSINSFKIIIQDSEYANERITFTIKPQSKTHSYLTLNGVDYLIEGSFIAEEREIGGSMMLVPGAITLKLSGNVLYDASMPVASVLTFDNGNKFNGFSTEKVYFTVVIDDVDETKIAMGQKNGVRFTDFFGTPRFATTGKDNVVPTISTSRELATYYDINSYVTIPSAFALDLFDPDVTVSLSITSPSGEVLYSNVETNEERILHLEECGQYIVEYVSIDDMKNKGILQFAVYSADTFDPVIEIDGQFKSTAKITEKYVIHKAITYDNNDKAEDLKIYVYVFGPDGYIETVTADYAQTEDVEYEFKKLGTYRIRYFVMDSYGNYCHKIFKVKVTE